MTMTMYKNIIRTAFLFATGIFMTACSSGDDELADSRTIVTPDTKENTVTLTGTISTGSDITRAVADDGRTVSWEVGDEICVQYQINGGGYSTVKGTITEVDNSTDTKKAKFTATLTNLAPNSTSNSIGLAYPYSNVTAGKTNATDFAIKDGILAKQAGTIDGINNAKLDIAWTESAVAITIDKATATLDGDAELSNQVCICKFNIKDGENALNARMLEITTGTNTTPDYIVTPANEQSNFYVVLPEISGKLKIEASTCGDNGAMKLDSENKLKAMKSTDVGSYISIDPTEGTDQYQAYLCKNLTTGSPASTTAKICSHTYTGANLAKDKFYEKNLNSSEKTLTPIAVVSSVGEVSGYWDYFLALALEDIPTAGVSTVVQAQTAATTWAGNHVVKVNSNEFATILGSNYDTVKDNAGANDALQPSTDEGWESSKTFTGAARKGWRIPSVTDFRYVFEGLANVSATNPVGIVDQACHYPANAPQSGSTYYATPDNTLQSAINVACKNTNLHAQFYWTSSVYEGEGNKGWRFHFLNNVWHFNSITEMSLLRAVLAY